MTLHLNIASTEALAFEPARRVLRLWPAVGGAQAQLSVTIRRTSERKDAPPYQVSAAMLIGKNSSRDRRLLTHLTAAHLTNPSQVATELTLTGFVSHEQLRVAESLREGAEHIWVTLQMSVTCVDGDPAQLVGGTGELGFDLPGGEWAQELERVDVGSYVEILVPLTSDNEHATAVRRLRKARELIRDNHLEEALGETRKAVEAIRAADGTPDTVRQARSKSPRDRDQRERWAFLVEDIFSLLSGAAHDDPGTTEHFVWTREDVLALVTATAGLLNRL
ncbi:MULTISPECIES: hypothetical protein [unclassified Crossiella]|uniref:hypothetical protein n=1 Tax=unclassified Crossiella TaxID=2620835 RepID=UPI0020001236|nr:MULTISPECIES: hypothetical protein [unclassified Crossiella]MCK2238237.1 hypothetical protein [Crossiella sp. S99.2]MCK2256277.1 hypothetical protein [Crossiella sp. S99.1]